MSEPVNDLSELFVAVTQWAGRRGAVRINELPGCWEADWTFDGMPATVSINGHREETKSGEGFDVPPFNALIMINGWPAVLCGPYGGAIMGGEPGTEDRLIAALSEASDLP